LFLVNRKSKVIFFDERQKQKKTKRTFLCFV